MDKSAASNSPGFRFRQVMKEEHPIQIEGTIIANHALLTQQAGFKAIYTNSLMSNL